jgi:hypothetical protein
MGVLRSALLRAGHVTEVERLVCDLVETHETDGDHRSALGLINDLTNMFRTNGRFEEALTMVEQLAARIRQAGLGRWMQLFGESHRLQIMNSMGEYAEVLSVVESLRDELRTLPMAPDAQELACGWNVRETLLDTGRGAAMFLEKWDEALDFNGEIVRVKKGRGADMLEILRAQFNDYVPLLGLERYAEVGTVLQVCRAGFENACDIEMIGKVFGALAQLEYAEGRCSAAVRFEENALLYAYQTHAPESCAGCHQNLAGYIKAAKVDSVLAFAHRLAAASIYLQISSGRLVPVLHDLATSSTLPATPPSFAEVVAAVEHSEGVRFADLFARLPTRFSNGEAAIAAVWERVQEKKSKLPPGPDMDRALRDIEPGLRAIAAAAGNEAIRPILKEVLGKLVDNRSHFADAVQRIWTGERDAASLTKGIDPVNARLVERILELLHQPSQEELLASLRATSGLHTSSRATPSRSPTTTRSETHRTTTRASDRFPKRQPERRATPKVGPNDPCPCGSGKKYKKCCRA